MSDIHAGVPLSDLFDGVPKSEHPNDEEIANQILGRVDESWSESRDERVRRWPRAWHMVYRDQWIVWNEYANAYLPRAIDRDRRHQSNYLQGSMVHAAAQMTASRPTAIVIPENTDFKSKQQARTANRLIPYYWRELGMGSKRYFCTLDMLLYGTGYIGFTWDELAGELVPQYDEEDVPLMVEGPDGMPMPAPGGETMRVPRMTVDDDGNPTIAVKDWKYQGSVSVEVFSPYNVFLQPGMDAPDMRAADYVVIGTPMSIPRIQRQFGLKREDLEGLRDGSPDKKYILQQPGDQLSNRPDDARGQGRIIVWSYIQKPAPVKGWEHGRVIHVAGKRVLGKGKLPKGITSLPLAMFPGLPIRGRALSVPWVEPGIEPQMRLNQGISHLQSWLQMACSPTWRDSKNSGLPAGLTVGGMGFRRIRPNTGAEVGWVAPPQIPSEIFGSVQAASADIDRTLMQFPISRGQHQAGIPSGYYAEVQQQADEQEMGPQRGMHAAAWEVVFEGVLTLARENEPEGKLLALVGVNGQPDLWAFSKESLPINYRCQVQESSLLAMTSAMLSKRVIELANAQLLGPYLQDPRRRNRLYESLRLPTVELEDSESKERNLADHIHSMIIDHGQLPEVIEPLWDARDLMERLRERIMETDYWSWTASTRQLVGQYFQMLRARLTEETETAKAEQDKMMQEQMDRALAAHAGKVGIEAQAEVAVQAAKEGTSALISSATMPVGAPQPGAEGDVNA